MTSDDFFSDGASSSVVDVPALFDSGIPGQIARLVEMGVLVSVGTTRDRGALSITVTSDGRWRREYFRDASDASDWLGLAAAALQGRGLGLNDRQAPAPQKPTTGRRRASRGSA